MMMAGVMAGVLAGVDVCDGVFPCPSEPTVQGHGVGGACVGRVVLQYFSEVVAVTEGRVGKGELLL